MSNRFVVIVNRQARDDLDAITDNRVYRSISDKIDGLKLDPDIQGKPLTGNLKRYRAVRAAGQRYRVVYQVAMLEGVVTVVVVGIRKDGDKRDAYEVARKRLK
jgi:Plasmid stabilisation system protein.